jgi:hypothetical protein
MPRPPVDFKQEIVNTLSSCCELPPESVSPWGHYRRSSTDAWNLVVYMTRNVSRTNYYPKAFDRHINRLHSMSLAQLVGAFERLLKELAAVCINEISDFTLDGRLDEFSVKGSVASAHFRNSNIGSALCETDTWLNCKNINDRFRKLLADPFETGSFYVFPSGGSQQPEAERFRYELITAVFQLRHTLVHNLGVLTESDTTKLRHMLRTPLNGSQVLAPSFSNVRQIKRFLDETAQKVNERIAIRLAALLTKMHNENALIFDPAAKAQTLANLFSITTSVCGQTASPIQALVR